LFERPQSGERAILVHINFSSNSGDEQIQEFRELAVSAGATPVAVVTGSRRTPEPKYLIGAAKAEEVAVLLKSENADLVLVDHELTPAQERNLERLLQCQVLDRSGLILDIFAQRASSHAGRLQVELAQLQHLSTRLVRGWTHLERQKGGIGLRGPGETQLETDRRLIGVRIKQLKKRLQKVQNSRHQGRRARQKAEIPTVSLVGYTNAGKSTLFNRMTSSAVYAADQLFATLDPTLRRVPLDYGDSIILADTVGFIRQLPHDLVEAFKSTLEETREAALLLHVVDAGDVNYKDNIDQVNLVLEEIGADAVRQIEVYNKIDCLEQSEPRIDRDADGKIKRVWLSAATGNGVDLLQQALKEEFNRQVQTTWVKFPVEAGDIRAHLYRNGQVHNERMSGTDLLLQVTIDSKELENITSVMGVISLLDGEDEQKAASNGCG